MWGAPLLDIRLMLNCLSVSIITLTVRSYAIIRFLGLQRPMPQVISAEVYEEKKLLPDSIGISEHIQC